MSNIEFYNHIDLLKVPLNSFAYKLTKDQIDAEDLFQDTAFRALNNKDKFLPGTNLKAWLFTIMKNIFINNYRKKLKANTVSDTSDNLFYINSGATVIANDVDRNLLLEELEDMISTLDENIRYPFIKHFSGFKYQEIADELQLPLGTVKSRIFLARNTLKKIIKRNYGDYSTIRNKLSA